MISGRHWPAPGANVALSRVPIGMHDYGSGLDLASFSVIADFPLAGAQPGVELAAKFQQKSDGVWELALSEPIQKLARGKLTDSVKDRQGNLSRIDRVFFVADGS